MNIEKVIMNVTLRGVNNQWEEGEVLTPPLPHEVLEEIKLDRNTVKVFYSEGAPQQYSSVSQIKTSSPVPYRAKRVKR